MVVNEILRRSCLSVRIVVESVSGWFWNECPDQPGITVRMLVEWVSEWTRNPQQFFADTICGYNGGPLDRRGPVCSGVHGGLLKWSYHLRRLEKLCRARRRLTADCLACCLPLNIHHDSAFP